MSDSVKRIVEVAVTPDVAFDVFTREIDAWYRVDRDTLPDITRTRAIRFEPYLGGRLLDVHDLATGEGRELGRITVWEPGARLVFVDNEATEIEVTFEPRGAGTRVTLTHRGLDRLGPPRAAALRRSGWPKLAILYRDHIAPNARPIGFSVGSLAVFFAVTIAILTVPAPKRGGPLAWIPILAVIAFAVAFFAMQGRLVRRWMPSEWQYRRISGRVFMLAGGGLVGWSLADVTEHSAHWPSLVLAINIVMILWWNNQRGPAGGNSLRKRASHIPTFIERHQKAWFFFLLVTAGAVGLLIPSGALGLMAVAMLAFNTISGLCATASRRRDRRAFGFDPDLYLGVSRELSEADRRPDFLVHEPPEQPEYSGWWAYGGEEDRARDFVAWSLKDLIDQAPEAVQPLREGGGIWRWDPAQGAYRRTSEHPFAAAGPP